MEVLQLLGTIVKMGAILAVIYGLLWALGRKQLWQKSLGVVAAFGVVQLAISLQFGDFQLLTDFDQGLLFQAITMAMVALGLNLIYGFNGQFSLAQWGFYGIGAYCAADITYRWVNGDARGLLVVGIGPPRRAGADRGRTAAQLEARHPGPVGLHPVPDRDARRGLRRRLARRRPASPLLAPLLGTAERPRVL